MQASLYLLTNYHSINTHNIVDKYNAKELRNAFLCYLNHCEAYLLQQSTIHSDFSGNWKEIRLFCSESLVNKTGQRLLQATDMIS